MKKQNELEISGVGKAYVYTLKVEKKEFSLVTPELRDVKTQRTSGGSTIYTDGTQTWEKAQLGYNVNGRFIQKVERTDKVVKYELVDKTEYTGNYLSDSWYVVIPEPATETKLRELGLYDDKVMVFTYKKSSVGMSFHRAVLSSFQGVLFMDCAEKPAFRSDIALQVKAEMSVKTALQAALAQKQEIVVKASEILVEV